MLDVWENEPDIDTELLGMVDIGTPHIAGYSLDGKIAGLIMIYKATCEYFNLEPKFDVEDFLPAPAVPEVILGPDVTTDQQRLSAAVQEVYPIAQDDRNLRQVMDKPADKVGRSFDDLRKNYPVRREFQNTRIVVKAGNIALAQKLKGIGFRDVQIEKEKSTS